MSVFNVQNNLSTLLSKAYNTETKATTANGASTQSTQSSATANTTNTSVSAEVTLGAASSQTGTYTAQGLMQQLRQYQLSNAELLFNSDDNNQNDTTGLTGLMAASDNIASSDNQDWVSTLSANPDQATVMVETTKNSTFNTILGN